MIVVFLVFSILFCKEFKVFSVQREESSITIVDFPKDHLAAVEQTNEAVENVYSFQVNKHWLLLFAIILLFLVSVESYIKAKRR